MKDPASPVRFVIIGGVAAGASAAARARRLSETASITLIERGPDVSFATCGLPYFIGGEIKQRDSLAIQTPQTLKALLALDVRTLTEAVAIDRTAKQISVRNLASGLTELIPYDKLLLAPGAVPLRPPLPRDRPFADTHAQVPRRYGSDQGRRRRRSSRHHRRGRIHRAGNGRATRPAGQEGDTGRSR